MEKNNLDVLIFGARGFIGRTLRDELSGDYHVYGTTRSADTSEGEYQLDLTSKVQVNELIGALKPDIIVNCAGIVDAQQDVTLNEQYTRHILQSVVENGLEPKQIIISGSAAEYGYIQADEIPVNETVPLRATAGYGLAKIAEERIALEYQLPVVVARIFNPVGNDMAEKFLISRIQKQIGEYKSGQRDTFELIRKDSRRDYIDVRDIAKAMRAIIEGTPKHNVYNIGSGKSTSNGELLQLMLESSKIDTSVPVIETSPEKEPLVAVEADVTRMKEDFGWAPTYTITDTVREMTHDQQVN